MKKLILSLFLCFIFAFGVCSGFSINAKADGITVNKLKFEIISNDQVPKQITDVVETIKEKKGFYIFDGENLENPQNCYYVFVGLGMQKTGGYSVTPVSVEDNEGKTVITVEEKSPAPGDLTTQAITYPYTVVSISKIGMAPNFVVKNSEGTKYDSLIPSAVLYKTGDVKDKAGLKIMKDFKLLVDKKSTTATLIAFIDKNIGKVSREDAGILINSLEAAAKKELQVIEKRDFNNSMQLKMTREFKNFIKADKINSIKDKKLKELLIRLKNTGFKVDTAEGMFYPVINYEFYKRYNKYVAQDMKDYISLMAVESNLAPAKDAAFMISWNELFRRALNQEKFLNAHKDSTKAKDIKDLFKNYNSFIIFGVNNNSLFSYDTKLMNGEARSAYAAAIRNNPNSNFIKELSAYYDLIVKNNFKLNSSIDKFRKDLMVNFK